MNALVTCPGCGARGRLPHAVGVLASVGCPRCRTAVPVEQLQAHAVPADDPSAPVWVDGPPADAGAYTGNYMKDEAGRFAQYVAARLAELHKRRSELTEAENRFESATMDRKQDAHRQGAALASEAARQEEVIARMDAKERELTAREADVAAREARVARAEGRAADADRRTAELRAAIDQLEARRAALADERAALDRRAEALDRAELALHRRSAELDELDERLHVEQDEYERTGQ